VVDAGPRSEPGEPSHASDRVPWITGLVNPGTLKKDSLGRRRPVEFLEALDEVVAVFPLLWKQQDQELVEADGRLLGRVSRLERGEKELQASARSAGLTGVDETLGQNDEVANFGGNLWIVDDLYPQVLDLVETAFGDQLADSCQVSVQFR